MPIFATVLLYLLMLVTSLSGFAAFSGLLPHFTEIWGLSSSESGWINGIYFAAYMASVPVLVSLTDRVDARLVYLTGALIALVAQLGFAWTAEGFWSALFWRALAGVGLGGTYMTGLKVMTDRLGDTNLPRATAFYTASFSIGLAASFFLLGQLEPRLGWRDANLVLACGPGFAFLAMFVFVKAKAVDRAFKPASHLLDFRPVLRSPKAMAYILAYSAHNWELFGMRAWLVAFLVFAKTQQASGSLGLDWNASDIATLVIILGLPSSVLGNEVSGRLGRRRVVIAVMLVSALISLLFGFSASWPYWLVVLLALLYGFSVAADSSSITTGAMSLAPTGLRGTTMALHSMIGFVGASLGPIVFGFVLDIGGGMEVASAWAWAFGSIALVVGLMPLVIRRLLSDDS